MSEVWLKFETSLQKQRLILLSIFVSFLVKKKKLNQDAFSQ